MNRLLSSSGNKEVIFVNDYRRLKKAKRLENKKLCIIRAESKDIEKIKKIVKSHPDLDVWIACESASRKNIIAANVCGIKNVIEYPLREEIILDILNNKDFTEFGINKSIENEEYIKHIKGLKIMVVDDNPLNVDLLKETLKFLELDILTFYNPQDAINKAQNEKFDLFLLDIMMPQLSGYELARLIKKSEINKNTPIVFISALSDNENKLKSYNLGSYIFVEKPFNVNIFKSQIVSLLKEYIEKENTIKLKDTYFAMVTHDMKTPVQAEISALNLLLNSDNFSSEEKEILKDILSSSKYLENLIFNVLQKYKSDNDSFKIHKNNHSLKRLITECCDEIKYYANEKNLTINVSYTSKHEFFMFDYEEIKRVIHNILTNALRHSYKNSKISMSVTDFENQIQVSIKNEGIGILLKNQNNIFDKFISYSENQKTVNSGLGLYICKKVITAHHGTIDFKSIPEKYTTVSFKLPLQ